MTQSPAGGFWSDLKMALRGSDHDYTQGPLGRSILLLAVPMVLEMVMESLFAVVDVYFVAQVGKEAVATVGLTESLLTLIYALAIGLCIGVTAVVARRIGEKNPAGAAAAAGQAVVLGLAFAVPIAIAGAVYARPLLRVMGGEAWVLEHGTPYARIVLGSTPLVMLLFVINAIFRGAGDAATAMRVLWLANGINLVLAPCLVRGLGPFPELGVTGAAVATTIGRSAGVAYQLYRLFRGPGRVIVAPAHLRPERATLWTMLRLSGMGLFQSLVGIASWTVLIRIVSVFGSASVAGYTIASRLIIFALLPSWGLSNAAATLVGQSLGAGKPERAEQAVWRAALYNAVFLGGVGLVFVLGARAIVGTFNSDPEVLGYGARCLRIVSLGFLFYAYGMVLTQAFNGAGDAWTPTMLNLFCFWILELPLAYVLAQPLRMGPTGAYVAITVAHTTLAGAGALLFRRGKWKLRRV